MQARRTLIPDQKGAKKFLDRYGEQLVCLRYGGSDAALLQREEL
jgi:hypothetical protein